MFFLSQIGCNIWRNKARSLLTVCIALLLLCFMGAYLGNLEKNQSALDRLADSVPVEGRVTNQKGTLTVGLEINTNKVGALLSSGVRDAVYTAQAGGNFETINRVEPVKACDTTLVAANSFSAFNFTSPEKIKMAAGRDASFITGSGPVCLVSSGYAAQHGIELGRKLDFPLYTYSYKADGNSFDFKPAGEAALTVIGIFPDEALNDAAANNLIVPMGWLRPFVEKSGVPFYCDSFRFAVRDPSRLNEFKEKMEGLSFSEISADAAEQHDGSSLVIEDKIFIETAAKLRQNVETLRRFQAPVFSLIVLLVVLAAFLLLRGRRREIAVASSLGQGKIVSAAGLFWENLFLIVLGCVLAVPILLPVTGTGWRGVLTVCLPFLACAGAGTVIALFMLLRFDILSLLTKVD